MCIYHMRRHLKLLGVVISELGITGGFHFLHFAFFFFYCIIFYKALVMLSLVEDSRVTSTVFKCGSVNMQRSDNEEGNVLGWGTGTCTSTRPVLGAAGSRTGEGADRNCVSVGRV